MKTDLKNAAAFLATAIWADGYYSEEEKNILDEIAEELKVDTDELKAAVNREVELLEPKTEEEVTEYLIENATAIEPEDVLTLMQSAIEIVLADSVLSKDEANVLFELADATGILSNSDVLLMVADLIKYDPEIEIKFE